MLGDPARTCRYPGAHSYFSKYFHACGPGYPKYHQYRCRRRQILAFALVTTTSTTGAGMPVADAQVRGSTIHGTPLRRSPRAGRLLPAVASIGRTQPRFLTGFSPGPVRNNRLRTLLKLPSVWGEEQGSSSWLPHARLPAFEATGNKLPSTGRIPAVYRVSLC